MCRCTQRTFLHFQFHLIPLSSPTSLKLYFSSCYVENFEVRVRVRSATGQKARVRAKCVRAKVVRCEVRACGQKSVTPNTLIISEPWCEFGESIIF